MEHNTLSPRYALVKHMNQGSSWQADEIEMVSDSLEEIEDRLYEMAHDADIEDEDQLDNALNGDYGDYTFIIYDAEDDGTLIWGAESGCHGWHISIPRASDVSNRVVYFVDEH